MKVEFSDVLRMHDEAYIASQDTRRKAADDLLFARVTQWDDPYLNTTLEYRGQFDQIRKARRQNLSEMRANPIQVTYIDGCRSIGIEANIAWEEVAGAVARIKEINTAGIRTGTSNAS